MFGFMGSVTPFSQMETYFAQPVKNIYSSWGVYFVIKNTLILWGNFTLHMKNCDFRKLINWQVHIFDKRHYYFLISQMQHVLDFPEKRAKAIIIRKEHDDYDGQEEK